MLKIELDRREATERQQQECLCKQKRKQNKQISKAIKKKTAKHNRAFHRINRDT